MASRNVQFYGSMNKALGGDPIQRDYAQDPRRLMAQQLMRQGSSTAPVQSPLEGLTRALTGIAGGYFGGQAQRDMQEREQARNEDINQVIAGGNAKQWVNPDTGNTTIQQDGIAAGPGDVPTMVQTDKNVGGYAGMQAALANIDNPDIANFRQNVAMGEMQERRALEAAAIAQKREEDFYKFKENNKMFAPKVPVPGKDIPLPVDVLEQKLQIAKASRPQWITTTDANGNPVQKNTQTGEIKSTPQPKAMTSDQSNAAVFADRMQASERILLKPEIAAAALKIDQKLKSSIPGVGNYLITDEYRMYDQAKRDFINATLRRESGAAIADSEFDNANKQYFPQPGDDAKTLAQKAANRKTAYTGISRAAGPSYKPTILKPLEKIDVEPTQDEIDAEILRRKKLQQNKGT